MVEHYRSIVGVHLVLVRDDRLLLTRRANTGWSDGLLHVVAGHLEAGEDVVAGVIREAEEEIGIGLARADLECVHVMHRRNAEGEPRVGFFFRATRWAGEPVNREPQRCSELLWCRVDAIPEDTVSYSAEAIQRIRRGETFSLHGWV